MPRRVDRCEGERRGIELVARAKLDEAQGVAPVLRQARLELVPGCRERDSRVGGVLGEGGPGHVSDELERAADSLAVEPFEQPPEEAWAGRARGCHTQVELVTGHSRAEWPEQRGGAGRVLRPRDDESERKRRPARRKASGDGVPLGG